MTRHPQTAAENPLPGAAPALLATRDLQVVYGRAGRWRRGVDKVSLEVMRGETLGLAGESGSGKSTLARALLGLVRIQSGQLLFDGRDTASLDAAQRHDMRRRVQIIFQDPASALSPRRTVAQALQEPLRLFRLCRRDEEQQAMLQALADVGLTAQSLGRYPHQFSSGQRQRIAIARALVCQPDLLIADEAVAALDVSVQAQVLELLHEQQQQRGIAMLFISHDLAVIRQLASRIAVMYRGRVVEQAPAEQLFNAAAHPYTRALLGALPGAGAAGRQPAPVPGNSISRAVAGHGCAYRPLCSFAIDSCAASVPRPYSIPGLAGHKVECHVVEQGGNTHA
jgi:oligopeptide/dipeptide ABC transporter ATP-binding protein